MVFSPTAERLLPAGRVRLPWPLAHYAPDRIVHPFVYSQDALIEAEPFLKNAYRELHPIIETA